MVKNGLKNWTKNWVHLNLRLAAIICACPEPQIVNKTLIEDDICILIRQCGKICSCPIAWSNMEYCPPLESWSTWSITRYIPSPPHHPLLAAFYHRKGELKRLHNRQIPQQPVPQDPDSNLPGLPPRGAWRTPKYKRDAVTYTAYQNKKSAQRYLF